MTEVDDDFRCGFPDFASDSLNRFCRYSRDLFLPLRSGVFGRFYDFVKSDRKFFYKIFIVRAVFDPRVNERQNEGQIGSRFYG